MTFKTFAAITTLTISALAIATPASAGGNYYGSHYAGSGHSHVQLGPADASEDFRAHARRDCRWLKVRAIETGYRSHWRAYRRCLRG